MRRDLAPFDGAARAIEGAPRMVLVSPAAATPAECEAIGYDHGIAFAEREAALWEDAQRRGLLSEENRAELSATLLRDWHAVEVQLAAAGASGEQIAAYMRGARQARRAAEASR